MKEREFYKNTPLRKINKRLPGKEEDQFIVKRSKDDFISFSANIITRKKI